MSFRMRIIIICAIWMIARALLAIAQEISGAELAEVRNGTVSFEVATSVPAVSVHGASNALNGRVWMRQAPGGLSLEQIDATLPPKTFVTEMELRDERMRRYIFTTPNGQVPDLRFTADRAMCPATSAHDWNCDLPGNMTIRGASRPLTVALKVHDVGSGRDSLGLLHAAGDAVVKLSDFGIAAPMQFGMKTSDNVKVHFDFTAKPALVSASVFVTANISSIYGEGGAQ